MNKPNKIDSLLGRGADDERRLALDQIDQAARKTNTFGSKEHREQREKAEKKHDQARRSYEALTDAEEYSAFEEPAFRNTFNGDLGGYLKWEQLGKSGDATPRLKTLLEVTKISMGQSYGGNPSIRATLIAAISYPAVAVTADEV